MKLRHKVIFTYTSLIGCSMLLISFLTVFLYHNKLYSLTSSFSSQLFSSKSYEISSWLDTRISEMKIISESQCIREMDKDTMVEYVEHLNQTVGTEYGNSWGTFAVGATDGIGYVGPNKTIDISKRSYFIEGLSTKKEYLLSPPIISKTDNSMISILHYPLKNEYGSFGFINAAINLDYLTQIVTNIDFYEGESFIMDSQSNLYTKVNSITSEDTQVIMNNLSDDFNSTINFTFDQYTYYFTKIPASDNWYLCTKVLTNNLTQEVSRFAILLIFLLILVIAITIVVCIYLARSITQPISLLNITIQKASTNLEIVADEGEIEEINSLSKSFNHLIEQIRLLVKQVKEDAKMQRQSEIKILQAQINPHFLYNTLDALNWKAFQYEDREMTMLIHSLCDFYRISLSNGDEFITIANEIKHVESYLNIQSIRFKSLFNYTVEVDQQLLSHVCLKVLLQPLVENAIIHGIKPLGEGGEISIRLVLCNQLIEMIVEDNGIGMDERTLMEVQEGMLDQSLHKYGLYNINQRIRLTYGDDYGVEIQSKQHQGTKVIVRIPKMNIEL